LHEQSVDVSIINYTWDTVTSKVNSWTPLIYLNEDSDIKTWINQKEELTVEKIDSISSLEMLDSMNPLLVSDFSWFNENKLLDFQKLQIKMWIMVSRIKDPEYIKLSRELHDINEWKEVWTSDLVAFDKEYQEVMNNRESTSLKWGNDIRSINEKRSKLMQEFQKSLRYKSHLDKHKEKIEEIRYWMHKYWTPEMIELDKEIKKINTEIYKK
jgi:hypothetical protein